MGARAVQDRAIHRVAAIVLMPPHKLSGLRVSETIDVGELSLLQRAHYYRRLGEGAARQAEAAHDEAMRSAYEFLAEHWRKLALATEEAAEMQDVTIAGWESPKQYPASEEC